MIRGVLSLLFASCLSVIGLCSSAFACSPPVKIPTLSDYINDADAIFEGQIRAVSDYEIAVRVSVVFKGVVRKNTVVNIPSSSSLCGIDNMKLGQRIVVYGQDPSLNGGSSPSQETGTYFRSSQIEGTHIGPLTSAERRRLRKGTRPK